MTNLRFNVLHISKLMMMHRLQLTSTFRSFPLPSVDQVETREGFALAPPVSPSVITIPEEADVISVCSAVEFSSACTTFSDNWKRIGNQQHTALNTEIPIKAKSIRTISRVSRLSPMVKVLLENANSSAFVMDF